MRLPIVAPLWPVRGLRTEAEGPVLRVYAEAPIDGDQPYLRGHFPGFIVFPGVFIVEFVCQSVALALGARAGGHAELRSLRSARFTAAVLPEDELSLVAEITSTKDGHEVEARCRRRDGQVAAEVSAIMVYPAGAHA
jgi:3-hydroxyacyl-[acyl-carrier-protein] dehydratase